MSVLRAMAPFLHHQFEDSHVEARRLGDAGLIDLKIIGAGHHGWPYHVSFRIIRSMSDESEGLPGSAKRNQLAIVGDMVRSISVVKCYPEYETLEEIARDFFQSELGDSC